MNILFFLTPKSEVAYLYDDVSLRQALEKMEYHRYSAIPIISRNGEYIGTITEGDFLWEIKKRGGLDLRQAEEIPLTQVHRRMDNVPVNATSNMEDLVSMAMNQNFVPVVDDSNIFMGIIKRKDIIRYCYDNLHQ